MRKTRKEIKMVYMGYDITIPKGTRTSHKTARGFDKRYNFIDEFGWIDSKDIILKHRAVYYGINIPDNLLENDDEELF